MVLSCLVQKNQVENRSSLGGTWVAVLLTWNVPNQTTFGYFLSHIEHPAVVALYACMPQVKTQGSCRLLCTILNLDVVP